MYPVEHIPDEGKLYYRVHKSYIQDGQVIPGAFREIIDGMSTDWEKYSMAIECRDRAKKTL